ncbi:MAG: hypothetical protein AAF320_00365 [Myxococcota bacterium]
MLSLRSLLYVIATGVCAAAVWLLFFSGPKYVGPVAPEQVLTTLQHIYENRAGFEISDEEKEKIVRESANSESYDDYQGHTYGEIVPDAAESLLRELQLSKDDVFYDLGSGVGKLVLHAHLATPVGKSVGVELSDTRHGLGIQALSKLRQKGLVDPSRVLQLRLENILTADLNDATVIYSCSTLFPDQLVKDIADKLAAIPRKVRVVTLKKFPQHPRLHHIKTLFVNTTWSPDVPAYVYETGDMPSKKPLPKHAKLDPREVRYILNDSYTGISGAAVDDIEELQLIKRSGGATSYGEITFDGVSNMLYHLELDQTDIFYDLGSGVGKLATQVHMMSDTAKTVGIELSETRHWNSSEAYDRVKDRDGIGPKRKLEFRHEDIAKSNFSDATVVYMSSAFFSKKLIDTVVSKTLRIPRRVKLVSLTPLKHKRLRQLKEFEVATTWSPNAPVYIYETVP